MTEKKRKIYLAGPMRGVEEWNFPLFKRLTNLWQEAGWQVFSPHNLILATGGKPLAPGQDDFSMHGLGIRLDIDCVIAADAIGMLPEWSKSKGATLELMLARFFDKEIYDATTMQRKYICQIIRPEIEYSHFNIHLSSTLFGDQ